MERKKRICLIQLPHYVPSPNSKKTFRLPAIFPVGVASLAAVLKRRGYEVRVVDCWAYPDRYQNLGSLVAETEPDVVGVSSLSTQYYYAKRGVPAIKKAVGVPVILGGAGPTLSPELFLKNSQADYCVIGEGEITLLELLENLNNPEGIKGIAYKDRDGSVIVTESRPYISSLDSLPFPDYSVFDMRSYLASVKVKKRYERAHTIITSRGCPYQCAFCSRTFRGVRYRSSEHVLGEIDFLRQRFGKAGIKFSDELFMLPRSRVEEIATGLAQRNVVWNCQSRIDLVDKDLLALLWQ
jgi:anaerobic magnesium-protoporphyrin IX monomethyl ester cyclase